MSDPAPRSPESIDLDQEEGVSPTLVARYDARRPRVSRVERDVVAWEEPLEIRLGDTPLAVVMRTPGHDAELALGFLLSERVVAAPGQVVAVRHCRRARDPAHADNVIRVVLAPGVEVDWEALRRNLYASSSCGICGKATLDNAMACAAPLDDDTRFAPARLTALAEALRGAQPGFARTGGLHAAGRFGADGFLRSVHEDIGRHNAVDKVLGAALREGHWPLAGQGLLVSGRISFEIVQKALAARAPLVAGVSAPSSLAIDLARRAGLTLVGFLRGDTFNVYSGAERIR